MCSDPGQFAGRFWRCRYISTLDISSLDISTCVQTLGSLLGVSRDIRGGLTELGSRRREHGRPEPELRREVRTQAFKMSANKRL